MYGQMTAGSWIYIGTQGILQGTYETFASLAEQHFGGTLAGRIVLTAALGGMGGAQPLAITMNEGVAVCVEVDPARIKRRLETRYLDIRAGDLDDALAMAREAAQRKELLIHRDLGERRPSAAAASQKGICPRCGDGSDQRP